MFELWIAVGIVCIMVGMLGAMLTPDRDAKNLW